MRAIGTWACALLTTGLLVFSVPAQEQKPGKVVTVPIVVKKQLQIVPVPGVVQKQVQIILVPAQKKEKSGAKGGKAAEVKGPTGEIELLKKAATARLNAERAAQTLASFEMSMQYWAAQIKTTAAAAAAAEAALAKANAEQEAAEKTLEQTPKEKAAAYAAAEKRLAEKTAAAKFAAARAANAKALAQKTLAYKAQSEKMLIGRFGSMQTSLKDAAEAEAAALGGLKLLEPGAWDYAKARHLLVRAGFGGTPEEVARFQGMGLHRAVAFLLDYRKQPALKIPFDPILPERPWLQEKYLNKQELLMLEARRRGADFQQMFRLRQWWLQRMVESPRPLEEKLTLFWHGHFTSEQRIVQNSYAMYRQNELFREQATGNFGALLHGIIHDPAMLRYLDNNTNIRGKANENLAREIMELFSMGEGRGYTEKDIMEAARALTGYTFDPYSCQFRFITQNHDEKPKTIFGKTGNWNGEDFVDLILQQPATSRFIAGKLFAFFAYEKPGPEIVERLASVLRLCDYELGPMLKNLFLSEEFYNPKAMGTQIKSPLQLVVGMYRELGLKEVNTQGLEFAVRFMGQDLFDPPNVKGWEGGRSWINANVLIARYGQLANILERPIFTPGRPMTQQLDVIALFRGQEFQTPEEVVDYTIKRYLAVPLAGEKRKELVSYLGTLPPSSQWAAQYQAVSGKLRGLLVLLFATPEYQMT